MFDFQRSFSNGDTLSFVANNLMMPKRNVLDSNLQKSVGFEPQYVESNKMIEV